MTTLSLYETIQRIVLQELQRLRTAELGIVQAQHPHAGASDRDNYACTVQLRDSGIVLKQVPVATPRIGSVSIPSVGDLVLVQFVGGDINAPVITGSLYNAEDRPPVSDDGQAILHLPLGAGDADALHLELHAQDKRALMLKLGNGLDLNLQDDDPVITLKVDGGRASIQVDRDGAIKIESQGDINLKGANVTIKADSQMTLDASAINIG